MSCDNIIKKKIKRTKKEIYQNEREQIFIEMKNIIGLNKDVNLIYLYDLEQNKEAEEKILSLVDKIKKCYEYSKWGFFTGKSKGINVSYVLLIKHLLREHNYDLKSSSATLTIDSKKINTRLYIITQNNN
jgi:5'-deoxynucleotidase YfbR-like HD superfamily hydrolase